MTLQFKGADGSASVNGRMCRASLAGDTASIDCPCASSFQVCSHALRLRLDVSTMRLIGEESFDFSYTSPAYCMVEATLEATRSRRP